jgi:hypothetical protein
MKIVLYTDGSIKIIPKSIIDKDFIDAILLTSREIKDCLVTTKEMYDKEKII